MKTTLQRWGNSQGVRIPKQLVERLGVDVGSEVIIAISDDQSVLTITPTRNSRPVRGRHLIEDLVAGSGADSFDGSEAWSDPQGKEIW